MHIVIFISPWFYYSVNVHLVKFTKVKVEYTRYQRLKCFSKYGIFYDLQGTHYRALCKYCWCCGSDNLVQVVPAMMLSVNITISMVPLDEIKTGLVGFTKCIILSKASMFPTMVQFMKCKIPIP